MFLWRRWDVVVWVVAAAAILPWGKPRPEPPPALTPLAGSQAAGGFVVPGVYPAVDLSRLPAGLAVHGSWLGSDRFVGEYFSAWYSPAGPVAVWVAGYPKFDGNRLEAEIECKDGTKRILRYRGRDPHEDWARWPIEFPADARAFRIHAVDHRTAADGWLAVSDPLAAPAITWGEVLSLLHVLAAFALSVAVIWGPGLAWYGAKPRPASSMAFAILPGPLLLAGLGALIWALDGRLEAGWIARTGLAALLLALAWARRKSAYPWVPREFIRFAGAILLLAGFAVAKATVSIGPEGELFRGTISRTLEVGWTSDSRIPFHNLQVAARHLAPFSPEAKDYFAPYSFASRGPLSGLLATPVVLAQGGAPPLDMPDQPWRPYDRQGFAAYRIALIVLASLAGWAAWAAAAELMGINRARIAAALFLLAPFFVHELFFTWPKFMSAACVLAALIPAHRGQGARAGLLLGLGYWFHPGALMSAPFVALWTVARVELGPARRRIAAAALMTLATIAVCLPWFLVGKADPHGVDQTVFLNYFREAYDERATWVNWWRSRWDNVADTFIPAYVWIVHSDNRSFNSFYAPSGGWVHYSLLYWLTFPFAVGLPAFLALLPAWANALRRRFKVAFLAIVGPTVWLVAYWGADPTGLMRQCGHVLFFAFLLVGAWRLSSFGRRLVFARWFIGLRAADLFLMAFGAGLARGWPPRIREYLGSDLVLLGAAAACASGAAYLIWREGRAHLSTREQPRFGT